MFFSQSPHGVMQKKTPKITKTVNSHRRHLRSWWRRWQCRARFQACWRDSPHRAQPRHHGARSVAHSPVATAMVVFGDPKVVWTGIFGWRKWFHTIFLDMFGLRWFLAQSCSIIEINGVHTHIIPKKRLKISMAPSHLVLGHWTQFPQGGGIDQLRISFSTLYVGDLSMLIPYLSVFAVFGGVISNSFAGQSSAIRMHDVSVVACLPSRLFFASPFGWPSYHSWYEVKPGFWLAMAGYILNVFVAYASRLASMLIGPPRVSPFCPTWWHVISTCFLAQFMGAQDRFAGSSCRQNVDIGVSVDILHVTLW